MPQITNKSAGFTLLELMVTIVIIAILTTVALPSYQDSVRKSRRATAQADLVQLASFMERKLTEQNSYTPATLPFTESPRSGTTYYNLTLSPTFRTFTLTATPAAAQVADTCGTLSLNHLGEGTPPTSGCWP